MPERRQACHRLRVRLAQDRRSGKRYPNTRSSYPIKNGEAINRGELLIESLGYARRSHAGRISNALLVLRSSWSTQPMGPCARLYQACNGRYGADADTILYNGPFAFRNGCTAPAAIEKNPYYWDADCIKLNVIDMPYVTNDANAVLNLQGRSRRAAERKRSTTLEHRWKINRFNDGSSDGVIIGRAPDHEREPAPSVVAHPIQASSSTR
jgi:hypothetical protein